MPLVSGLVIAIFLGMDFAVTGRSPYVYPPLSFSGVFTIPITEGLPGSFAGQQVGWWLDRRA